MKFKTSHKAVGMRWDLQRGSSETTWKIFWTLLSPVSLFYSMLWLTKPCLCTKLALFKMPLRMSRMLPYLSPLGSYSLHWELSNELLYFLYLNGYQKYQKSMFKVQVLSSKCRYFYFDLLHFWSHLKYKVIQYLVGKLWVMVNMSQEK